MTVRRRKAVRRRKGAHVADIAALVMRECGQTTLSSCDTAMLDTIAEKAAVLVDDTAPDFQERRRNEVIAALRRSSRDLVMVTTFILVEDAAPLAPTDTPAAKPKGLAKLSPEERSRIARLGGLAGNRKKKGFASMNPERQRAIARMGAATRKTRHVFTREESIIAARISNHGDTKEQAAAYAAQAMRAVSPEQRLAIIANTEAEAIANIATAAGRKVQPAAGAPDAHPPATQAAPAPPRGTQPVPASERDAALLAQLEADLVTARAIQDEGQRELFQLKISEKLVEDLESRHAARRATLQAKRDARINEALQRRSELGFDNTEILASLGQKQKSD